MQKLIFFSLCLSLFSIACAQKKTISSKITCIQPYCGGARPTPQMEADAQKPKPYTSKMIIIVSDKGKVDSAKTDASGLLKKKLDQGNYKLYESWRHYKSTPNGESVSH